MPNRLIHETSPYLLQHAHNPVDWYPWGPEALQRAQAENKPILLSIGYSACHWCHVMERESFENDDIAALMNRHFINIKVDREERPDLDAVYMEAVQLLTGSGGWPMTVFLTPDGKPFYGGTYFPPTDRANMPGFPRLLEAISRSYFNSPAEIERVTGQLTEQMGRTGHLARRDAPLSADILHRAYSALATNFDYQNGGTGGAPKFPQAMTLEVLLRYHAQGHNPRAMEMLHLTLEKMARGGIYDQLGGGFHRYSVDAYWLVPHFEKMLYDNALLARLYLHAWLASGRALYRRITEETLDYILREMTGPPGGFYSATDADSEGVEGKFFVWSLDEIEETLGGEEGPVFAAFFGVTPGGNFEGSNILNIPRKAAVFAGQHNLPMQRLVDLIQRGKETLRRRRAARIPPLLDDKVLASWNGLMLKALAEAGAAWQRGDYLDAAARNAAFLLETMRDADGRLLRTYRDGQAKLPGYLEDYSFVADGLLSLYEATFDRRWLNAAIELADTMLELFWDEPAGAFYDTGRGHEDLVVRPRDVFDNAQPCGSSVAADLLLRLAVITGNDDYRNKAVTSLQTLAELMARAPAGTGRWLAALDFHLSAPKEVAVLGPRRHPGTAALLDTLFGRYLPNKVVVGADEAAGPDEPLPLLQGRGPVDGQPTAYVCRNYACLLPVTDAAALAAQLDS